MKVEIDKHAELIKAAKAVVKSHMCHWCPGTDREYLPACIEVSLTSITELQVALDALDAE